MRKWTTCLVLVVLLFIAPATLAGGEPSDDSSWWTQIWDWIVAVATDGDSDRVASLEQPEDEIGPTIIPGG